MHPRRFPIGWLLGLLLLSGCTTASSAGLQTSPTTPAATPAGSTATQGPSPTPPTRVHGDWQTYTDLLFGFQLDVPTTFSLAVLRQGNREDDLVWMYNQAIGPLPSSQTALAQAALELVAADGTNPPSSRSLLPPGPYACRVGTPITIGAGTTAYQQESYTNPTPPPGDGAIPLPSISVNMETGGVYLYLVLFGPERTHFLDAYGPSWQHILNSFVPGPAVPNGHPCA
jgi:hypothetical protein